MRPPLTAATSLFPSAEEAMQIQLVVGALFVVHVAPPSADVQMPPPLATAANRLPSAEEARQVQRQRGAVVLVQRIPALVEMNIGPGAWKL